MAKVFAAACVMFAAAVMNVSMPGYALADGEIFKAIKDGDGSAARLLLAADPEAANRPDAGGATPLHMAAFKGKDEVAGLLLDGGADVNAKDCEGSTPLHVAALGCRKSAAALFIDRGADITARDNDGWTPLFTAAFGGCKDVVELLLERGADPRLHDYGSKSAAFWATKAGHKGIADLLTGRVNGMAPLTPAPAAPPGERR
ncbi:MAG: ankyrin repeat domain-containing protein [Nitrospirae bacterium]|nr:ankyrin repeat domain-containing protein [Nitrospirota bacterium]MBI5696401.1 ankyrin repeat domain-containing protein [Nitrospirota bacterium]